MGKKHIVIGASDGMDSSVTAWLLKRQGCDVVSLSMKNWKDGDNGEYCSAWQNWIDTVPVADLIGVDVEIVNFAAEYKDHVFTDFLHGYSTGRTLNPDVPRNVEIKFRAFLDHATALGADMIVIGHYARVRKVGGRLELLTALDHAKGRSYFLHHLSQAQLPHTFFPLGEMSKAEVRGIAAEAGLLNTKKKDSMGVCFIDERPLHDFLNRYLPTEPGPIKTPDSKIIGEYIGLAFYMLEQHKNIDIGGSRNGNDNI